MYIYTVFTAESLHRVYAHWGTSRDHPLIKRTYTMRRLADHIRVHSSSTVLQVLDLQMRLQMTISTHWPSRDNCPRYRHACVHLLSTTEKEKESTDGTAHNVIMVAYLPEYKEPTEDELYEASVVIRRRMDFFDVCELFHYARRPSWRTAGISQLCRCAVRSLWLTADHTSRRR